MGSTYSRLLNGAGCWLALIFASSVLSGAPLPSALINGEGPGWKAWGAADFANEVIPILTRSGCNSGSCHGKKGGRDGFRLSLLGYEPEKDFRYIVYENRGRRASPAAPDQSLILQKATGEIPHEGGVRWEIGSEPYEALRRWIAQGMIRQAQEHQSVRP